MESCAYDIEVFPNFFSIIFVDLHSDKSYTVYKINDTYSESFKDYDNITNKLKSLVGYNNLEFDDNMLKYFEEGRSNIELFESAQALIHDDRIRYANLPILTLDLFKIMHHDRKGISLKQCAINMQWPKIQDLPLPHDAYIKEEDVQEILKYNMNDVLITKELFHRVVNEIKLRIDVGEIYSVNVINKSRSGVGDKIMEKLYAEYTGTDPNSFKYNNTKRDKVAFKDCIHPKIQFKTNQLQSLLHDLKNEVVICSEEEL